MPCRSPFTHNFVFNFTLIPSIVSHTFLLLVSAESWQGVKFLLDCWKSLTRTWPLIFRMCFVFLLTQVVWKTVLLPQGRDEEKEVFVLKWFSAQYWFGAAVCLEISSYATPLSECALVLKIHHKYFRHFSSSLSEKEAKKFHTSCRGLVPTWPRYWKPFSVRDQKIQRGRKRQKVRWLYTDKVWKIQHEIRRATALFLFLFVLVSGWNVELQGCS